MKLLVLLFISFLLLGCSTKYHFIEDIGFSPNSPIAVIKKEKSSYSPLCMFGIGSYNRLLWQKWYLAYGKGKRVKYEKLSKLFYYLDFEKKPELKNLLCHLNVERINDKEYVEKIVEMLGRFKTELSVRFGLIGVEIQVSKDQHDRMVKYFNGIEEKPKKYTLLNRQCTTIVARGLSRGKIFKSFARRPVAFLKSIAGKVKHSCGPDKGK